MIQRRSFLTGLVSLMAAPAIVRASSLMPIKLFDPVQSLSAGGVNSRLAISMITREAIKLFSQSNEFLRYINTQYDEEFAVTGIDTPRIGSQFRIRLPQDYSIGAS